MGNGIASAVEYADDYLDNFLWPKDAPKSASVTRDQLRAVIISAHQAGQDSIIHRGIDYLRDTRLHQASLIGGQGNVEEPICEAP